MAIPVRFWEYVMRFRITVCRCRWLVLCSWCAYQITTLVSCQQRVMHHWSLLGSSISHKYVFLVKLMTNIWMVSVEPNKSFMGWFPLNGILPMLRYSFSCSYVEVFFQLYFCLHKTTTISLSVQCYHGQNINLTVCVCVCLCVCVRHTFCQLAYRSDPSTDFYSW